LKEEGYGQKYIEESKKVLFKEIEELEEFILEQIEDDVLYGVGNVQKTLDTCSTNRFNTNKTLVYYSKPEVREIGTERKIVIEPSEK